MAPRPVLGVLLALGLVVALVCLSANHTPAAQQTWEQLALTAQHVISVPWSQLSNGGPVNLQVNGQTFHLQQAGAAPAASAAATPQRIVVHLGSGTPAAPVAPVVPVPMQHIVIHMPQETAPTVPAIPTVENVPAIISEAVRTALEDEKNEHHVKPTAAVEPIGATLANPTDQLMARLMTNQNKQGELISQLEVAVARERSENVENMQLRKQLAQAEAEETETKAEEQQHDATLRTAATKMGTELKVQKEKYERLIRSQAVKLTREENIDVQDSAQDKKLEAALHRKVGSNVKLQDEIKADNQRVAHEETEETRVKTLWAKNKALAAKEQKLKTDLQIEKSEAALKEKELKKEKETALRDLRLKMINEGARIKRVEEQRAVEAIAKFANEDKIHLTKQDIKSAANTIEDEVPPLSKGNTKVNVKFPRVYMPS